MNKLVVVIRVYGANAGVFQIREGGPQTKNTTEALRTSKE
jgi:hypothetical protein